jgi:hypothetical protein
MLVSDNIFLGDKLKKFLRVHETQLKNFKNVEIIIKKIKFLGKKAEKSEKTNEISQNLVESKRFFNQIFEKLLDFKSIISEKSKLKIFAREKVQKISADIEQNVQEIELSIKKYENLKKSTKILSDSYEKVHKLIAKLEKPKEKEKICTNCNKTYIITDNFNWSCKRHTGIWNGKSYWCCSNDKKDSPGCIISFHMPNSPGSSPNPSTQRCIGCKEKGHSYMDCYKDPNCISTINANDEIQRIKNLKKNKVKVSKDPKLKLGLRRPFNEFSEFEEIKDALTGREDKSQSGNFDMASSRSVEVILPFIHVSPRVLKIKK